MCNKSAEDDDNDNGNDDNYDDVVNNFHSNYRLSSLVHVKN